MEITSHNPSDATDAAGIPEAERQLAMLSHLLGLFTAFLGPLLIWQLKLKDMPVAAEEAKEALNFQIGVSIAYMALGGTAFLIFPIFVLPIVAIGNLVLCIKACMSANSGVPYKYPLNLRLVK